MYYLLARDLDGDGICEYIADMEKMIITEDPQRALQLSERELDYLDMDYLNQQGFYAREIERYNVPFLAAFLFRPPVRGYRPHIAPPPRRPRGPHLGGPGPHMGGPSPHMGGPGPHMGGPGPHLGGLGPHMGGLGGPHRGPGGRGPGPRGGGHMGGPGGRGR